MRKTILSLIVLVAFTITSFAQQPNIVITEIMYSPPAPFGTGGVEYLELYNNDTMAWNLAGFTFSQGITFTFPSMMMNIGDFVLLTNDSVGFAERYGMTARQYGGFISNVGEDIVLKDAGGQTVDSVDYDPFAPWPESANGGGPSLTLCAADADNNDPASWQRAITSLGFLEQDREMFGSPGSLPFCHGGPIVQFELAQASFIEFEGTIDIDVIIDNQNVNSTTVDLSVTSITASTTTDVMVSPSTITFVGSSSTPQSVSFTLINDTVFEPDEEFILTLSNSTNNSIIGTDTLRISITDDDAPVDKSLVLVGIFDGWMGGPSGVELYARENIPDLSIFGLGCANNGMGSDGIEYNFPSVSVTAGTSLFVTNDSAAFNNFFGFDADFIDNGGAVFFNGNDAFEVFENFTVIDVYGQINVDGTGQVWEYGDGWGHRIDSTGPDCDTFIVANWEFSGTDVFDNATDNASASDPYPIGTFDYPGMMVSISPVANTDFVSVYPNPASDKIILRSNLLVDRMRISDISGKIVLESSLNSKNSSVDVSILEAGIYILNVSGEGKDWIEKIVIQ